MTKEEDFKLLKIQTFVLKVNIHCDGCKQKVKKLLQRIEGVYQVNIDAEQQKVTVSGSVDAGTLIKKLVRAGKHAEIWSQKSNQNQKQQNNCIKDDKNNNNKGQKQGFVKQGVEALKHQGQKFPAFVPEEEDDCFYDGEDDDDDDADELRFMRANQLGLLRQQQAAIDANNNAKKNIAALAAAAAASNNVGNKMMTNNLGNGNKGGNPNQNLGGMKINQGGGGIDPATMAAALKMNNAQLGGGEGRRGTSDIGSMMNLAGFPNGNGNNLANAANVVLGGNPSNPGLGGFQVQSNNGYGGGSSTLGAGYPNGGYALGGGVQYPSSSPPMQMNMSGYNHPAAAASMMMNMQNRHQQQQQQPQLMYQRSPFIPPSTGYYYNYNYNNNCYSPSPATAYPPYYLDQQQANYSADHSAATHMFSDENTSSSCSIM